MDAAIEPGAKKQWKQKNISVNDIVGGCTVPVRHNALTLVGESILLKWYAESSTFTVSGKYGVLSLRK
ncbi:hypothetical protein BGAL_0480g00010 [Botrytis galanthina]|uniref:Uncharacterized protein n=1 Tax=Botrytis galanthina TaxID=278940 RepID=A0A4S8QXI9_9HELO|nr:hypothetical protein BGAL_0480g00010 [Botrytis galanthina]